MIVSSHKFLSMLESRDTEKCRIVGKFVRNRDIKSCLLEFRVDNRVIISEIPLEKVIELIHNNRILGCKVMSCNGNESIMGIARLPVYRDIEDVKERDYRAEEFKFGEMMVIGKIVGKEDRRKTIGYEVLFKDGTIHNIDKNAVVRLTKHGIIRNLNLIKVNGVLALSGAGIRLKDLHTKELDVDSLEVMG